MKRVSENAKRAVNGGFYYFSNNRNCNYATTSYLAYRVHKCFCSLCCKSSDGGSYNKAGARSMNKSV